MKITELKCTACHGTLKVNENNPKIAICEYCQTKHILEYEDGGDVHFGSNDQKQPPQQSNYIEITQQPQYKLSPVRIALAAISIAFFCVFMVISRSGQTTDSKPTSTAKYQTTEVNVNDYTTKESDGPAELTGALAGMAESAIGKPSDSLTAEDLSRFAWLKVQTTTDFTRVGYSFDNPFTNSDAALTWVEFPRDDAKVEMKELSLFSGLKFLEIPQYISNSNIQGLKLEGITCYSKTPGALAGCFENPGDLKEVNIQAGMESLDGIEQFKGVERLSIGGSDLKDISALAGLKQLKSLTLINSDNLEDVSVLHVMTWLKELSIDSEVVKDIGFVEKMPELETFKLYDAKLLNLDSLVGNQSLTSLTIEKCRDLKSLSAVGSLTDLKHLTLEVPYNCEDPDLNGLTQLESLVITGMKTTSFLQNMPNLITLEIVRCKIDNTSAFAALGSLKTLKCSHLSSYDDEWGFIAKIPTLETLNMAGVATYKDVSVLFNIPTLKELNFNGMECELNFSKLQANEALEVIKMDGVKLYKNVKISGGGGIVYVDYDKVTLDEHIGFLTNYPSLRELSLADNKLSGILFAEALNNLERININENYVTDLKPLEGLINLKSVSCKGNPVENYRVLSEDIIITK